MKKTSLGGAAIVVFVFTNISGLSAAAVFLGIKDHKALCGIVFQLGLLIGSLTTMLIASDMEK